MTTIGPNIKVEGLISGDEDLTIFGRVDGTLNINANVVIAENGQVHGTLIANEVIIRGHVQGTINASNLLVLEESARVVADIETASLRMEAGAQMSGDVVMDLEGEVPARKASKPSASTPQPAPPKAKPKPAVSEPVTEVADDDEYEEIDDLNELTVKELRELCEDYDLSTKGTKAQLIKRLEESE